MAKTQQSPKVAQLTKDRFHIVWPDGSGIEVETADLQAKLRGENPVDVSLDNLVTNLQLQGVNPEDLGEIKAKLEAAKVWR